MCVHWLLSANCSKRRRGSMNARTTDSQRPLLNDFLDDLDPVLFQD